MNKKKITWAFAVILLAIITFTILQSNLDTSFTFEHFPLTKHWATRLGGNIQQITTINNQFVLVRTEGELYAVGMKSGNIIWHQIINWQFTGKPVFARDGIVFLTDAKGIWALDQNTGNVIWHEIGSYPDSAVIIDISQGLVAVSERPEIAVYKASDGSLQWSKVVCSNTIPAYFHDTSLYAPCDGISALDIYSGNTVWETKSEFRTWVAAYDNGVMYSSPDLENVIAYDLQKHYQLWSVFLPNDRDQGFEVNGEYLFVTDHNKFCALHRSDGSILWCDHAINNPQNPTRIGNVIYVFNGLQNVISVIDLSSGAQIGQLTMTNFNIFPIDRQLMVSSDELLIFGSGHELFAFGK